VVYSVIVDAQTYIVHITMQRSVADLGRRGGGGGAPPIGSYLYSKSRFFPCKGIYFVVRICDKWGRSW